MGAFNRLLLKELLCPACNALHDWIIQFKYGDCWQHDYVLQDELKWEGNDEGDPSARIVLVEGIAEDDCQACNEEVYARIFVDNNRIVAASLVVERIWFTSEHEGEYIVINK
ncbi:hypothetical protein [Chitinophaga sp.]|uniref:hypothetical protein n=1 Tax=Chitinophaga sp. TaxID=1869181 RepID=UPI0031DB259F